MSRRLIFVMMACAALWPLAPRLAMAQVTNATVVASCGGQAFTAGQNRAISQDTTGQLCGSAVSPPSPSSSAGIVPTPSPALESCRPLKAGAGNLYSLAVTIQATSGIVQVFDATSAPADGAVTPVWAMPVLSNGTFGGANWEWTVPMNFLTGITVCFSSATTPFIKTASATAMFSGDVK